MGYARKGATNTNCVDKNQQPTHTMSLNGDKIRFAVEKYPDIFTKLEHLASNHSNSLAKQDLRTDAKQIMQERIRSLFAPAN